MPITLLFCEESYTRPTRSNHFPSLPSKTEVFMTLSKKSPNPWRNSVDTPLPLWKRSSLSIPANPPLSPSHPKKKNFLSRFPHHDHHLLPLPVFPPKLPSLLPLPLPLPPRLRWPFALLGNLALPGSRRGTLSPSLSDFPIIIQKLPRPSGKIPHLLPRPTWSRTYPRPILKSGSISLTTFT